MVEEILRKLISKTRGIEPWFDYIPSDVLFWEEIRKIIEEKNMKFNWSNWTVKLKDGQWLVEATCPEHPHPMVISGFTKLEAEKYVKEWMPEVKWLVLANGHNPSYIEFVPND
jgi:hypothetical protein